MADLNLEFSRKKSVSQFNFSEFHIGINIPLTIFGKDITDSILKMVDPTENEDPSNKGLKKQKKESVKLNPAAVGGILASLLISAMAMPDKK